MTITFVSYKYPMKLMSHLRKERGYLIIEAEKGIYYIQGDYIPIQIIVAPQLAEEHNLYKAVMDIFLHSTTDKEYQEQLFREFGL